MTVQELADKLGLKDTDAEYKKIHEIYLNGEMSEDEFCVDYMAHKDSIIIEDLYERCQVYEEVQKSWSATRVAWANTIITATAKMLIHNAEKDMDEKLYKSVIDFLGRSECIKYKLNNNLELNKQDKEYIRDRI